MPAQPAAFYEDDVLAAWWPAEPAFDYQQIKRRRALTPNLNATFYYAVSFYPQDGFATKTGASINTLTAGP